MSWNIKTPGDFINGPLTVTGAATITGNLTVQTNKLFVNATGAAVGTTSIFGDFTVQRSTNARFEIDSSSTGISYQVVDNARTGYLQNVTIASQHLWFIGITEAMRLTANGLGIGGRTPSASGVGIAFPATQSASTDANTLDDYEEGTFTPTVQGTTTAGTATYSEQTGRYTKVGRVISISIRVTYSAGNGTGNLRVAGLPFVTGSGFVWTIYAENVAMTAGNSAAGSSGSGVSTINLDQLPAGGGVAQSIPYDATGDIQISGTYTV